jgi:outer membrane protein OmpA-like peptidoglycan-associated protein
MSDDRDNEQKRVVWAVLVGAILLAVGTAVGVGISRTFKKAPPVVASTVPAAETASVATEPAATAAAEPVAPVAAPVLSANESAVRVENGVVKFYFASGKADLAAGAKEALAEAVTAAGQGHQLLISGYHDSTGSPQLNATLAKRRALSVQTALKAMGVKPAQMTIQKAQSVVSDGGADAQARRVEVAIQ